MITEHKLITTDTESEIHLTVEDENNILVLWSISESPLTLNDLKEIVNFTDFVHASIVEGRITNEQKD